MKLLIKQALILDTNSPYHLQRKDIQIDNGLIVRIEDTIPFKAGLELNKKDLTICNGFVDLFAHFNDPGFEQKETLESGTNAAQYGGYTKVMLLPNTHPVIDNKSQVDYIINQSPKFPVQLFPIGAVTIGTAGKSLTEMIEMHHAGVIAFSDGIHCIQNPSLLLKALQYIKQFDGIIIQMPYEASLTANGFMNESITSNQLGLMGIPALAEELIVARDIELCNYTKSRIHFTGVSTAKSIQLIKEAKQQGLPVTCSVSPYHLYFTEEDVEVYNTNVKVNPPLRTQEDKAALQKALLNGDIDCVASHHLPHETDAKQSDFAQAAMGMSTIEFTLNALASIEGITDQKIVELLSTNTSQIFKIKPSIIAENQIPNCTAFTLNYSRTLSKNQIISKGKNCGWIGKDLKGKVHATILEKNMLINE